MDKPNPNEAATVVKPASPKVEQSRSVQVGDCLRDRFILEEEIGRGGMGIVFRALDLRKQETGDKEPYVALKIIGDTLKRLPEALIALQREAKKAQKLAHPNVATVYDFDRDGENAFITMELLQGKSLADLFRKEYSKGLSFDEALPIIQGMAQGLAYAHEQGFVHSDFKPGNIYLCDNGAVKLLDFGIARASAQSTQSLAKGEETLFDPSDWDAITPAYASFEMFYRAPPDPRDDIYALACVGYQLLSGKHPFEKTPANNAKAQGLKFKALKHISRDANNAIKKGLSFERKERLKSVSAFLELLEPKNSSKVMLLSTALIFFAVFGAGLYFWQSNQKVQLIETAIEQGDPWLSSPQPVDAETSEKISRLLTIAKSHLSIGRYVKPSTSNAAEAYMEVLRLQPGNPQALEGTDLIVQEIQRQVIKMEQLGKMEEAQNLLSRASAALPGEKTLLELEKQLSK